MDRVRIFDDAPRRLFRAGNHKKRITGHGCTCIIKTDHEHKRQGNLLVPVSDIARHRRQLADRFSFGREKQKSFRKLEDRKGHD